MDCPSLSVARARDLLSQLIQPVPLRRARIAPELPGAPSFTVLAVEAVLVRREEVDLAALIRKLLTPLVSQAERRRISLRMTVGSVLPIRIAIDVEKIGWAVTTLVGNALRYVRQGGEELPGGNVHLHLSAGAPGHVVSITVEDDGPGIAPNVRPWLFAPEPATGRATSVALRMVQEVAKAHGGGLVVKSSTEPDEGGTSVALFLPAPR